MYKPETSLTAQRTPDTETKVTDFTQYFFKEIGENPQREGLIDTPRRHWKALKEMTSGYSLTLTEVVGSGVFKSESNGIVAVNEIEFHSLCEHHLLPFWGKISIAYQPNEKILGLSKLARIVDMYSKRLQVQERLTREVADAIKQSVDAKGVYVAAEAQHMCMMMRGIQKQLSSTRTEHFVGDNQVDLRAQLAGQIRI